MNRRSLLLIEDDQNLSETVCDYLEGQGFAVTPVYDAEAAEEALYERRYDLILLDVNIPGLNGFELLKKLRDEGMETPAIYLTARQSVEDLEEGFRSGGDDYLRKPFALKELLIRIESLLERGFYHRHRDRIPVGEGLSYDPGAQILYGLGGEEQSLSGKEAKLLELFLRHPGEVLSHERIYGALWDYDEEPSDNALRTYVKNLRKRIGKERIVSLKKQGYRYVAPE
ncbi:response regulator transcription factor [Nitratifractor sp.]